MISKKGDTTLLSSNIVYIILVVLFLFIMLTFLWMQMNGASVWGDYYAKEISKIINLAEPDDEITLDIQKATEIASKNEQVLSETFTFYNGENKICVKLSQGRQTCYYYFNNVDIISPEIKLGVPTNILTFKISEKLKNEPQS